TGYWKYMRHVTKYKCKCYLICTILISGIYFSNIYAYSFRVDK
uniref:Uncharacterized protein n=1 Tax=Aegilops tauschii subsp. strangulata TaxID=200361 RepID=A0A453MRK3_AEGTS